MSTTPTVALDEPAENLGLPGQILWRILRHLAEVDEGFLPKPRTVGEVLALYRSGEINQVPGLGRTRMKELCAALERAGLDIE